MPNNDNLKPIQNLKPFTKFCCTIGAIPTSYLISLTYEEQLLWLCDYLENTVIPTVNNNAGAVTELQNLYQELKSYVDNYFTNLDVQEEINNKLDQMATDGTLASIINQDIFNQINTNITKNTNDIATANQKIITNTENINQNTNTINLLTNKKYVFIGDSYADGFTPDGSVTPWQNYVKRYLKLRDNQFITNHKGGAGFTLTLSTTFYSLINSLTNDNTVTDVVICGGYNDRTQTSINIINGISQTINLIKSKFPNATTHIGFIGNTSVQTNKFKVSETIRPYIEGTERNNAHYLSNVQYALHNYYTMFSSDGIHPNEGGQIAIASAISQALQSGTADVIYTYAPINSHLGTLGTYFNNNITTLTLRGEWGPLITLTQPISCNGNNKITLTTVTNGYICGDNASNFGFINIIFRLVEGGYKQLPCRVAIIGNEFNIYPIGLNDNNTSYYLLNASQAQIKPFSITFNSLYC